MTAIKQNKWVTDLEAMTCCNMNNGIIICFEKTEKTFLGKIKYMPIQLIKQWAELREGYKLLQNAVTEAEKEFFRAYIEKWYEEMRGMKS